MDISLSKLLEMVKDGEPVSLQSMWLQRVGHNLVTEQKQLQKDQLSKFNFILFHRL